MNSFRFDFGVCAPKQGYVKIAGDMTYSHELGYGIIAPAEGELRNTGEVVHLRDFLHMRENGFRVKLSDGTYHVRVFAGDYEDNGDVGVGVQIHDKKHHIWVRDRSVCTGTYEVEVTDGILELFFEGRYVCINGIDICPVNRQLIGSIRSTVQAKESSNTLNWEPLKDIAKYRIYKYDDVRDILLETVEVDTNHYVDTNVDLCASYRYQVCGVDDFDFETELSRPVFVQIVDGKPIPKAPEGLQIKAIGEDLVHIVWDPVENAVDYQIYQKAPYGIYKKIGIAEDTSYIDTEVVTAVEFIYAVAARTPSGWTEKAEIKTPVKAPKRKRKMEALDRGLIAVKTDDGVFLSWRLLGEEYEQNIAFHLCRNGEKITEEPVADSTNYLDAAGKIDDVYTVKAIKNGKTEAGGYTTTVINGPYLSIPLDKPEPFTTPDGLTHFYSANDASVADLDGDGEYEIVLKWDAGGHDNAHKGYTGLVYLDAYKLDGRKLWRINLGVNIRAGAHYTQFMVYDFNGDGKAELICKTADGTIDGRGNVIGDIHADYRNKDGFILEGPEYLTAFDGETGEILDTVDYDPPRGNVADWGDSWGNRVDRFLACVAYLDGVNPSAVMCRGYYDHGRPTHLAAYDLVGSKLVKRWKFVADKDQNIEYTNQGNHNLGVGDIDGDGRDEIVYGACAIDHDGTGIYSTRLEHGDAMHLGKFDPHSEGLDFFQIHEHMSVPYGYEVRNPATGEIHWGRYTGRDTARGLTANIDPRYEGNEVWAIGEPLFTFRGEMICEKSPASVNFAIWWDGDLQRELLDHKWLGPEVGSGIGQIYKWDHEKEELKTLLDTKDAFSNNYTKGNPCIQADIFGDWREEVVWRNEESTELRIYTTTELTKHRIYTLMHDPVYRLGIAWQNTAYNQPPHTSFYIGEGMEKPPVPDHEYVKKKV